MSVCLSVCLIRLVDRVERSLFSMPIRQADRSLPRSQLTDPSSPFTSSSFSASSASEMQNQFVQQEAAEKGVNFVTTSGQIVPGTLLLPTTETERKREGERANRSSNRVSIGRRASSVLVQPGHTQRSHNTQFVDGFTNRCRHESSTHWERPLPPRPNDDPHTQLTPTSL